MTKYIFSICQFFLFLSLNAQETLPTASLNLIDPSSKTASDVDIGEGLNALITLPLVPAHKRLDVEVLVFPEFKLDEAPLFEKRYRAEKSDEDGVWQKKIRIPSFRNNENTIRRFGRVARLRITWKDPSVDTNGTLIRKFYLLEHKEQKFFKIVDPGDLREPNNADPESICSYRKNAEIVGPYLQNPSLSVQDYEYNQSVAFETLRYRGPLNASAPDTLGLVEKISPIFQILDPGDLGWLMTGWTHYEGTETKLSLRPKISLLPAQGGHFLKETLMRRFKVQKYTLKTRGRAEWIAGELGLLDVGTTQYDFLTLKIEDTQDPAKLERLVADRSSLMTTCKDYPTESNRSYHTGETNTLHEELYFRSL